MYSKLGMRVYAPVQMHFFDIYEVWGGHQAIWRRYVHGGKITHLMMLILTHNHWIEEKVTIHARISIGLLSLCYPQDFNKSNIAFPWWWSAYPIEESSVWLISNPTPAFTSLLTAQLPERTVNTYQSPFYKKKKSIAVGTSSQSCAVLLATACAVRCFASCVDVTHIPATYTH